MREEMFNQDEAYNAYLDKMALEYADQQEEQEIDMELYHKSYETKQSVNKEVTICSFYR